MPKIVTCNISITIALSEAKPSTEIIETYALHITIVKYLINQKFNILADYRPESY